MDMSQKQEIYMVEMGKVGYFGFSVLKFYFDVQRVQRVKTPSKCPPEVQAQSGFAERKNGFWLPYPKTTTLRGTKVF